MSQKFITFLFLLSSLLIAQACIDVCRGRPGNHFAANERGCAWYWRCNVGREAEEDRCPEPYFFNYERQICDWKENVQCKETEYSSECPSSGIATVPHPNVCSKYTVCIDGAEEDRDCPPGLHYSPYDKTCVIPRLAECTRDRTFCIERNNGSDFTSWFRTINQRDCTQYYVCTNNEIIGVIGAAVMRCDAGLHVNPDTFECQLPLDANCDPSEHPPSLQYPGFQITHQCQEDEEGTSVVHPQTSCYWFFCAGGRSHLLQCGIGTNFNPVTKRCIPGACSYVARSENESSRRIENIADLFGSERFGF